MKINLDIRNANNGSGIGNYIKNIAINSQDYKDWDIRGCSFKYRGLNKQTYKWYPGIVKTSIIPDRIAYNDALDIPLSYDVLLNSKVDLNLFLTYRLPNVRFQAPVIAAIHDIILIRTQIESKAMIEDQERIMRRCLQYSKYIITVSEYSKLDIAEYFGYNPDHIFVVHNGINMDEFSINESEEQKLIIRKKYRLPNKYILNFGVYRKHKNIERLVEAYSMLSKEIRSEVKLVLTCENDVIKKMVLKLNINNDVFFTGFIADEDKPLLYKMSECVYYASLFEGFGVPIIEAQACGVPIITSNVSSMPEAAADGALFVNPYNINDIHHALEKILVNQELRKCLVSKGYINSNKYSWHRSVKELHDVLFNIDI